MSEIRSTINYQSNASEIKDKWSAVTRIAEDLAKAEAKCEQLRLAAQRKVFLFDVPQDKARFRLEEVMAEARVYRETLNRLLDAT